MPLSREASDRLDEQREALRPRPFDLDDEAELARLLRETAGYARVSLHHGTDRPGRELASFALDRALRLGYRLVKPKAT